MPDTPDYPLRFAQGVEHGDVGRGHADDVPGVAVEYLSRKIRRSLFAVAGDEELRFLAFGSLPRGVCLQYRAFHPFRSENFEARGIGGGVEADVEIPERGGGSVVTGGCGREDRRHQDIK